MFNNARCVRVQPDKVKCAAYKVNLFVRQRRQSRLAEAGIVSFAQHARLDLLRVVALIFQSSLFSFNFFNQSDRKGQNRNILMKK